MKNKKKIIIPVVLLLVVLGVFIYSRADNHVIGEFEAVTVPNVSEVSGKVIELKVQIGQSVKAGDVLAVLDSENQVYTVEQLEIKLEQAMLALGDAAGGSGSSSGNALLAAQSNYNSAAATAAQASSDYKTASELYAQGAITKDALDKSKLAADTAANAATVARANLSSAGNNYSKENAGLSVALLQSQLEQARRQLDKYTICAACDGVVISTSFTEGTIVSPGYDIADIASKEENYLVAYFPEEKIYKYDYDQTLEIKYNGKNYDGVIKYIDLKSGYTPKDLQTSANKNKDSFKVKLLLPADCPIKASETATVQL